MSLYTLILTDFMSLIHISQRLSVDWNRHAILQFQVSGSLQNTGRDLTFTFKDTGDRPFTFTGGPFSYTYTIYHIKLHFGIIDDIGSEHTIAGKQFPLEVSLLYTFLHIPLPNPFLWYNKLSCTIHSVSLAPQENLCRHLTNESLFYN